MFCCPNKNSQKKKSKSSAESLIFLKSANSNMYCAYRDCSNVALPFSKISFFALPTDSRRDIWIENSGNEALRDLSAKTKKVFCETHFDAKDMRKQFMRTTLRKDAVPLKYVPSKETDALLNTTTLTELFDVEDIDDVEEEAKMNPPNETEQNDEEGEPDQVEYVYILDDIDEDDDEATNKRKVVEPKQSEGVWGVGEGENGVDEAKDRTENVIPNKRSRKGSTGPIEPLIAPQEKRTEKTKLLNNRDEAASNHVAQKEVKETRESSRYNISSIDSQDEETFFALSLVRQLKRLPPQKLAIAKCHISTYLTQLEFGDVGTTFS